MKDFALMAPQKRFFVIAFILPTLAMMPFFTVSQTAGTPTRMVGFEFLDVAFGVAQVGVGEGSGVAVAHCAAPEETGRFEDVFEDVSEWQIG